MNKIALVTGARKGLGFAWASELASMGYTVYLTARNKEQAQQAADLISGHIIPLELNISDENSIINAAKQVENEQGKLDLLINNAGVNPKDNPNKSEMEGAFYLDKLNANSLLETIQANSISPMLMIKNFKQLLSASNNAIVINISSWLGSVSNTNMGVHFGYCGSKNLLNMFNKIAANDLKSSGIISVAVNPGWVQTDMGGSKAQFTPQQAVQNIIENIVSKVTLNDTGKFLNYSGEVHPW